MSTGAAGGGSASIVVDAPADRLWALITDITRTAEWSPENTGGVWLEPATGPAVGARFRGTNRRRWARWTTTCEVIRAEPGREFVFVTGSAAKPQTVWRYVLEPEAGGTRVTESFELGNSLGALGRLITRVTIGVSDRRADLEENLRTSLRNLKRIAEA